MTNKFLVLNSMKIKKNVFVKLAKGKMDYTVLVGTRLSESISNCNI